MFQVKLPVHCFSAVCRAYICLHLFLLHCSHHPYTYHASWWRWICCMWQTLSPHICRYLSQHPSHCLVECSSSKIESSLASVLMSISAFVTKHSKCPLLYFLPTWCCEMYHLQSIYFYLSVPTESVTHTDLCKRCFWYSCMKQFLIRSFNTLGQFLDHM